MSNVFGLNILVPFLNSWVNVIELRAIQGNQKHSFKLNPLLHQHNCPISYQICFSLSPLLKTWKFTDILDIKLLSHFLMKHLQGKNRATRSSHCHFQKKIWDLTNYYKRGKLTSIIIISADIGILFAIFILHHHHFNTWIRSVIFPLTCNLK